MALSTSTTLLTLFIACETVRANYAYHVFKLYPQISPALIALLSETLKLLIAVFFLLRANDGFSIPAIRRIITSLQGSEKVEFKRISKFALPAALYLVNNLIYYTVLPKT